MAISPLELAAAAATLARGGVVAFPTETVYGLGANAMDPRGLDKLLQIKNSGQPGRGNKPLIVHLADAGDMDLFAQQIPDEARDLARAFWPGPLTLVLKARPEVSALVTGGGDTVGLRVPNHPVARAMIRALGKVTRTPGGVAASSANRSGEAPAITAGAVRAALDDAPDLILDGGECSLKVASTVIGLGPGGKLSILREGGVPIPDILVVLMGDAKVE